MDETPPIISRATARAAGLKRYFTGEPCSQGHIADRSVDDCGCSECRRQVDRERKRKQRAADPERHRENMRKWRSENLEHAREYGRQRYARTQEQQREFLRSSYRKYRDARLEQSRARRAADPEHSRTLNRKSAKKRRSEEPEHFRELGRVANKAWRAKNPERDKENARKWRKANQDSFRAAQRRWREAHPDRVAAEDRLKHQRRRARKHGAKGDHTKKDIARIWKAQLGACAYYRACGNLLGRRGFHVDHIVALSKGGSNAPSNLQLTCPSCNAKKNAKDPIDFAQELGFLI